MDIVYPDYHITTPTLQYLIPERRANTSLYEIRKGLRETQALNQHLLEQIAEMHQRLSGLESYREDPSYQ